MGKGSGHSDEAGSDFCVLNDRLDARLSDVERLTFLGGASLDRLLSTLARSLSGVSLESLLPSLDLTQLLDGQVAYTALRASGEVSAFLDPQFAHGVGPAEVTPVHGFRDGAVFDLSFHSPFPDTLGAAADHYRGCTENQSAYARVWEHADRNVDRTTVVAIHGWTMGDQRVNSLAFLPGFLYSLGFNVAIIELPFHGRRRPHSATTSLSLFPSADPCHTLFGVAHALRDLRALERILRERDHATFSCIGMSLGAYLAALWLSLDRLERAVLLVPLVSMGDMAWNLVRAQKRAGQRVPSAITRRMLRDLFWEHSALAYAPVTEQRSILVVGGKEDHLIPTAQVRLLKRRWPHAEFAWFEGGHAAVAQRGEAFTRVVDFLQQG